MYQVIAFNFLFTLPNTVAEKSKVKVLCFKTYFYLNAFYK